jgi:uncharacterized lipoprotein
MKDYRVSGFFSVRIAKSEKNEEKKPKEEGNSKKEDYHWYFEVGLRSKRSQLTVINRSFIKNENISGPRTKP